MIRVFIILKETVIIMKFKYLGTAAAEGIPALFCECETCAEARRRGGREIRSRSQALIDGKLMIDLNADTWYHSINYGIDMMDIKALFFTHTHADHFYPQDLSLRRRYFANLKKGDKLEIYCSQEAAKELEENSINDEAEHYGFTVNVIEPFKPFHAVGYGVTAVKAEHGTDMPLNFIISDGKTSILYAHDTGIYNQSTFDYMKQNGMRFDFVSLDCTAACQKIYHNAHMNLENCMIMRQKLMECGAADKNTDFCLNHFTHNAENVLYKEFSEKAAEYGFDVSYDGKTIVI